MDGEQYPSLWERAGALGIDAAMIVVAASLVLTTASYGSIVGWGDGTLSFGSRWLQALVASAALAGLWRWWTSPGEAAMSLAVVDSRTGARPSLLRCAVRAALVLPGAAAGFLLVTSIAILGAPHALEGVTAVYFGYMALFGLGVAIGLLPYLPCALNSRRRSLWDYTTRTLVVRRARAASPAEANPVNPALNSPGAS